MKLQAFQWALVAALLSLGSAFSLSVPLSIWVGTPVSAPFATAPHFEIGPTLVAQGEEHFAMSCSQCHGDDAHGDEGPDLHNLPISNARIIRVVKKGIKGEMPPFEKKYNDEQIAALVSYLRTLN